jgi:hypothetical protein
MNYKYKIISSISPTEEIKCTDIVIDPTSKFISFYRDDLCIKIINSEYI